MFRMVSYLYRGYDLAEIIAVDKEAELFESVEAIYDDLMEYNEMNRDEMDFWGYMNDADYLEVYAVSVETEEAILVHYRDYEENPYKI